MVEFPNGELIHETSVIIRMIDDLYPGQGLQLFSKDPYERAHQEIFLETYGAPLRSSVLGLWKDPKNKEKFGVWAEQVMKTIAYMEEHSPDNVFVHNSPVPTICDIDLFSSLQRSAFIFGDAQNVGIDKSMKPDAPKL